MTHSDRALPLAPVELVDRLGEVAMALEYGDVDAARALLERTRRAIDDRQRGVEPHLHLVGGIMLTERETAALGHLTDGSLSQKDIARHMNITRNTLKTHLKSLYHKLGVHGRGEAIVIARELGLLPRQPMATPPTAGRGSGGAELALARVSA